MSIEKNSLNSVVSTIAQEKTKSLSAEGELATRALLSALEMRAVFLSDDFVKKVENGNRKALAALQRYPMPPTQMDLRNELARCVRANVPANVRFEIKTKVYLFSELKLLVPQWAMVAERALIQSDPALADKLMSQLQWNAKSAFEVIFFTAVNELKNMRKNNQLNGTLSHYTKWILNPLRDAIAQVKQVAPPTNCLIGYGDKIPLADAMKTAEGLEAEFKKTIEKFITSR